MMSLLIYGGTFDPPHYGHLNTARAVQEHFHFNQFIFLPCKSPLLKNATLASAEQRVEMLKLALANYPEFQIDLREIERSTPSFMVDTLENFRQEFGEDAAITLCVGMDAFKQLHKWHCWQKLLTLCNLLVIKRADMNLQALPNVLKTLLEDHETFTETDLHTYAFGKIYRFDAGEYPISSTWLRSQVQTGHDISPYLPENVYQYIKSQALYLLYPDA